MRWNALKKASHCLPIISSCPPTSRQRWNAWLMNSASSIGAWSSLKYSLPTRDLTWCVETHLGINSKWRKKNGLQVRTMILSKPPTKPTAKRKFHNSKRKTQFCIKSFKRLAMPLQAKVTLWKTLGAFHLQPLANSNFHHYLQNYASLSQKMHGDSYCLLALL